MIEQGVIGAMEARMDHLPVQGFGFSTHKNSVLERVTLELGVFTTMISPQGTVDGEAPQE